VEPIEGNRALWDELTPIHVASDFYDVDGFRSGRSSLRHVELGEMGDVAGKSLLHLQCHFGLDTISWARLGADATGVDLSPRSIEMARLLARQEETRASFHCTSIYDLEDVLDSEFDIVFTSYGALQWLPDIRKWAQVVFRFVKPGGIFYLVEFHPVIQAFGNTDRPELTDGYFYRSEPVEWISDGTYAQPGALVSNRSYQWHHPVGDVVSALVDAGMEIDFLHEHPAVHEQLRSWMVQDAAGWWRAPNDSLPVLFSLRARKKSVRIVAGKGASLALP
jgi:SAM-dependent methyltransferase